MSTPCVYNEERINELVQFVSDNTDLSNKATFTKKMKKRFGLETKRSVYYCDDFAVRVSYSKSKSPCNTIIALSRIRLYDHLPFFLVVVSPNGHRIHLINSSFIEKVSNSAKGLSIDKIVGSITYPNIYQEVEEMQNVPCNFKRLFLLHSSRNFQDNLRRIVSNTDHITGRNERFELTEKDKAVISASIDRAIAFTQSKEYAILKQDLEERARALEKQIETASKIDNVNIRGRVIEYLLTCNDDKRRKKIMSTLRKKTGLPAELKTENQLGDYHREIGQYKIETDIKTKVLALDGNPKGYNVDKLLRFLAEDNSVFMIYLIGINKEDNSIKLRLCSIYDSRLSSRLCCQLSGRNSRGGVQFDGSSIKKIFEEEDKTVINAERAKELLNRLVCA